VSDILEDVIGSRDNKRSRVNYTNGLEVKDVKDAGIHGGYNEMAFKVIPERSQVVSF
jgi:hypothetical protein